MSLAQELNLTSVVGGRNYLSTDRINRVENVNERLGEIVAYIESSQIDAVCLNQPPIDEELGSTVSEAFASNPHTTEIVFMPDRGVAMRDLIPWIASRGTLARMTSLEQVTIAVCPNVDNSIQDYNALFSLLLTSTSLQELRVYWARCDDDAMIALASYLGTSSIVNFDMYTYGNGMGLSQTAFCSLCDGVAHSTLQKLTLHEAVFRALNVETAAESLARAIFRSSLEEVTIRDTRIRSALARTTSVQNLDFAFSHIGNDASRLRINQKWKPLVSANILVGLWPRILKKAYTLPETSHGPVGILFYLLREKPELVSGTT